MTSTTEQQAAPLDISDQTATDNGAPRTRGAFSIRHYEEIPVELIEPHPNNPRPTFHLDDDDPGLIGLGEAIRTQGQTNPALVYERVGGWRNENEPGRYRLYQGERRWRSCKIAGVPMLRCLVATTPKSEAEEWSWLGVEEAFKQPWQTFFVLRYCRDLAEKHKVSIVSPEIAAKTGVSMNDLRIAEKVFKLHPAIQAYVAQYEELMYQQLAKGLRTKGTRLSGPGIRSREFPVGKAALVWDIFSALRENFPLLVEEYSDVQLQKLIARKATHGATIADLQKLYGQLRQAKNAPPMLMAEIAELLENPRRPIKQFIRNTGNAHTDRVGKFMKSAPRLRDLATRLSDAIEQTGNDIEVLQELETETLKIIRDVGTLERAIGGRIADLKREQR